MLPRAHVAVQRAAQPARLHLVVAAPGAVPHDPRAAQKDEPQEQGRATSHRQWLQHTGRRRASVIDITVTSDWMGWPFVGDDSRSLFIYLFSKQLFDGSEV